jgi:hypothetical protein
MAVHADLVGIGGFAVAEQVDATAGCSFEGAGLGIRRYVCGRHEALVKGIKKDGKPERLAIFQKPKIKRSNPI